MSISVKVSKKELTAYLLTVLIAVIVMLFTVVFADIIKEKTVAEVKSTTNTVSMVLSNSVAVTDAVKYSEVEIAQQISESKAKAEEILAENNITVIYDFTAEEENEIMKGNISPEDAVKLLSEKNSETNFFINNNSEAQNLAVNETTDSKTASGNADKVIGDKITRLYGLKAYYMGKLGNMLNQAKQEYKLFEGSSQAKSLAGKYLSQAAALEQECDSQVYTILGELESELEKQGQSKSIVNSIEEAYLKEKRLKKSYYLTNYMY